MEKRQYGKTDMQVSVLGFGGSEIGYQNVGPNDVERLLLSAFEVGLNVIDTAECYMTSEELIGKTVSHRRSDFYLFTKCGHASGMNAEDWNPQMLAKQIDRSLTRLRTEYVDVIHLHSCSLQTLQQGAVIEVLQRAQEAGKTRYIGYSGDGQAAKWAIQSGLFDSLETSVNIADQEAIDLFLPEAMSHGVGVIAKRPIANAAWATGDLPASEYARPYYHRLQELKYDFLMPSSSESIEHALRFTLTVPGVHTAIVGTSKPSRYEQNAKMAARGPITRDEYEVIRSRWHEVAKEDWVGLT